MFIALIGFPSNNIYVKFVENVNQQCIDISMGTNCAPLPSSLLDHSLTCPHMNTITCKIQKVIPARPHLPHLLNGILMKDIY